jgi:hypothetical protein
MLSAPSARKLVRGLPTFAGSRPDAKIAFLNKKADMKTSQAIFKALFTGLACGGLAIATADLQAAKAPLSKEQLEKEALHIVSGTVTAVTSKVQKSKHERAFGIHRDRVYTIKLKVTSVSKGTGVKEEQEIVVEAWQPSTRIPPLPGLQGHNPVPGKGDTVKMYLLKEKQTKRYEPLLPNGIDIQEKAKKVK